MLRHSSLTERRITSDVGGSSDGAGGDSNLAAARGGGADRVSGPDRLREAEAPAAPASRHDGIGKIRPQWHRASR